ncbi:hypothetical protein A2276_01495 [candidate division WOR-1 bacterium RIFOXYA12_FULL_43_27]|uniref:Uncharacterized protein n=1 Tax=candidate division WOR-1 bacterium RIFOXYC2_FULL_46_14 TaxID=1802587 RepID=A0A1F4U858_UNCSA|nr:MAG: hypothetical protein A2276_01495 [candidate division WOR-1 bacterium RIFOXYA12_FULL_43_27]OGC20642.1 MAG: hypothetical protein A2292_06380 [candidate division WOR-1 bacterium RIFOXYB2_FULL_46_45]OGC31621.1 MAG: hypothetical protein A2232_05070 [candidate division WOR-1 bacterium RIFOXYA2_FULL_46_56]OGC40483.1 MAG: hypothetical protein A2438_04410 [candidate division WOR-1 bacterium RIFOXYC2_FULL_46_14]
MQGENSDNFILNFFLKKTMSSANLSDNEEDVLRLILYKYISSDCPQRLGILFNVAYPSARAILRLAVLKLIASSKETFTLLKGWSVIEAYILDCMKDKLLKVRLAAEVLATDIGINYSVLPADMAKHIGKYGNAPGDTPHARASTAIAIKERLFLPDEIKNKSPFYELGFYPGLVEHFRSHEVFWLLAKEAAKLPRVIRERAISLIYPGSGSHLAPLDLLHNLIRQKKIDRAAITYTEISEESLKNTNRLIQGLAQKGIYSDLRITTKEERDALRPITKSETVFLFNYLGKKIELRFKLNMSGFNYYNSEDLERADVWIVHDPIGGAPEDSLALLSLFFQSLFRQKQRGATPLIVMENLNDDIWTFLDFVDDAIFVGDKAVIPFPYGHRGEFISRESGISRYRSALAFWPKLDFWRQFSLEEIDFIFRFSPIDIESASINFKGKEVKIKEPDVPEDEIPEFKRRLEKLVSIAGSVTAKLQKSHPHLSEIFDNRAKVIRKYLQAAIVPKDDGSDLCIKALKGVRRAEKQIKKK